MTDAVLLLIPHAPIRAGKRRADTLQSFRLSDAPAIGESVQLADSKDRFTERFARSFQSRVESALLRQTRCRLSITHFLLLIRIDSLTSAA